MDAKRNNKGRIKTIKVDEPQRKNNFLKSNMTEFYFYRTVKQPVDRIAPDSQSGPSVAFEKHYLNAVFKIWWETYSISRTDLFWKSDFWLNRWV